MPRMPSRFQSDLEKLAERMQLDYFPVEFELVPPAFMMEVAVYGLPVRMPHWSFGVRYIHQLVQHRMGYSRIFEVVFPGNPGHAFLANNNSLAENTLVYAHVLGHADFSKNNELFRRTHNQVSHRIVDLAAGHAQRIEQAIEKHGRERVEQVLDAALALEQHIDVNQNLERPLFPTSPPEKPKEPADEFHKRFESLTGERSETTPQPKEPVRLPIPPRTEYDLLWFLAHYAPEMEDWERDIFLAVREESFYFYPVFACQIMNEGWASYWHARLLREASFLPQDVYLDAMKAHSDVVRPVAADNQVSLSVNPYHLGFAMWDQIVERDGMDAARKILAEEDDFSFIRNWLDADLAEKLDLFVYEAKRNGEITVGEKDIYRLHEALLGPKFNFGSPRVGISELRRDGTLELRHEYETDGRGLDLDRARHVMNYIHRIWRRPVVLQTVDARSGQKMLTTD
ncbi:MAG: SpoVR family protein [Gammaproteobacteria bacterium]